jgi:Serine/Threonine/Tyrosine Kinase found in polyvalent proteins
VEHDVIFDHATGTVLKFTKPEKSAYAVNFELGTPKMTPATPLEYLERLEIQNEIFGDNLRFVGVATNDDGRRIITRQDLVTGRAARWEEIVRMMNELGFTKLRHNHRIGYDDSYAFVRDDAVVFDMRPANVFVTDDGITVPVDSIPVRLPPGKRAFFDK